jgi:GR25 family glycosyltransferase involved in LPS biosynthesis
MKQSSLLHGFGAAFVINLQERTDRRNATQKDFSKLEWNEFEFFPACHFNEPAGFNSTAWRGCFHSHLEIFELASRRDLPDVLIFEDDIALCSSIVQLTPKILSSIQSLDWDILYFGHESTGNVARANSATNHVTFEFYNDDIRTTHFYTVRKRIIPKLIRHFERCAGTIPHDGMYGPMPPDGALNTFRRYNPDVKTYIANPKLGWQRPSRSDLAPRSFDKIKALRPAVNYLRRLKHLMDRARND